MRFFYTIILCLTLAVPAYAAGGGSDDDADVITMKSRILEHEEAHTATKALKAIGMLDMFGDMERAGKLTIFIPSDDAFYALLKGKPKSVEDPRNKERLKAIFEHSTIEQSLYIENFNNGVSQFMTLRGDIFRVDKGWSSLKLNGQDVKIIDSMLDPKNGHVFIIDQVLIPENLPALGAK